MKESRMSTNDMKKAATKAPEYAVWKSVRLKCTNPKAAGYDRFGGRGKLFATRWQGPGGFDHFLSDVGSRPFPRAGLELIDPTGHYEPGNVRWAGTRPCRLLTHDGRTMSIAQWARELNIRPSTLRARLHDNLPPEEVFVQRVRTGMHMKPFKAETREGDEFPPTEVTAGSERLAALIARAIEVAQR